MKVAILMRDAEYRKALVEAISGLDMDILVEVAGAAGISRSAVILTDIMPAEIEEKSLAKICNRTVFLSPVPCRSDSGMSSCGNHVIFKYCSITEILAELTLVYSEWTGDTGRISPGTKVIAVTGESDIQSSTRCRSIAGQILYRVGGSILILPLGYINDYRSGDGDNEGWFRRLMYLIDEGRSFPPASFTTVDSYGISCLRLPGGVNPLTRLGIDYLRKLTAGIGQYFDTVMLDIGTCFSDDNLRMITAADEIVFFGSGRRTGELGQIIGREQAGRAKRIDTQDAASEALSIDDFVRDIYGQTDQKTDDS